jgi:hypothetical protein
MLGLLLLVVVVVVGRILQRPSLMTHIIMRGRIPRRGTTITTTRM